MKQLIFVVETNVKTQTDSRYINKLIKDRYNISNDTKIQYCYMNGKTNYKSNHVLREIKKYIKINENIDINAKNYVIYCFDTDEITLNNAEKNQFLDEINFCKRNNYHYIWFNTDIEYAILGKKVNDKNKGIEAQNFSKSKHISINYNKLSKSNDQYNEIGSNLFYVLDKLLDKK